MKFNRTKYCKCSECPLDGNQRVFGYGPEERCKIAVIGSHPNLSDVNNQQPYSGKLGKYFNYAIGKSNIRPYQVWKTFAIACRPDDGIKSIDGAEAMRCCRKGFLAELEYLHNLNVKVFVPMTNTALDMMKIPFKITKIRGSVVQVNLYKVIGKKNMKIRLNTEVQPKNTTIIFKNFVTLPTFEPYTMTQGQQKEEVTWVNDFKKIKELSKNSFQGVKENFELFPTVEEIEAFRDRVVKVKPLLACDIETTGLDAYKGGIICIGFATSTERCVVIARLTEGNSLQWVNGNVYRVKKAIKDILSKCPTAWQNALFDVPFLAVKGYLVKNVVHDTMLAHHCIHAELPHNLGYITSVYGKTSYWKDEFLNRSGKATDMGDKNLRTYNARDCVVIHQILPPMLEELRRDDTLKIYENISIPLIKPVSAMIVNGIKVDVKRLAKWKKQLIKEVSELTEAFTEAAKMPEYFKLTSTQHLIYIFFGVRPNSFEKLTRDYEKYFLPDSKLKRNTKKFAEISTKHDFFSKVQHLEVLNVRLAETDGGSISTSEDDMKMYYVKIRERLEYLNGLKKPQPKHHAEHKALLLTETCLKILLKFRKRNKMLTTYTNYYLDFKDRVHPKYKIHGTATGRLSSNSPNGQNIPFEAKHIFIVKDGNVFLNADYSGIEVHVIAYAAKDLVLIDMIKKGLNFHDENTKRMFNILPDDLHWKSYRACMKTYIFGRNYGGSLRGMYKRMITEEPDITVTYKEFCKMDEAYFKVHPAYKKWFTNTQAILKATRCLENGFGRKRYFLGTDNQILREGLNFPIQSTAGDIMSLALIDVNKALTNGKYKTMLIGSVHDSMMLEVPKKELDKVLPLVKKHMATPRKVFGKEQSFPVDFEIGPSWGELKKIKEN